MDEEQAPSGREELARRAADATPSLWRELLDFVRYRKKWWLTPIVLALLLIGLLVAISATAVRPFLYTVF